MVTGAYVKATGFEGGDHQPHLVFRGEGGVLIGHRTGPGVPHGAFDLRVVGGERPARLNQLAEYIDHGVSGHIVPVKDGLEGQRALCHFLEILPLEGDTNSPAPIPVPLPLGRVVPVERETGGKGGVFLSNLVTE